MLRKLVLGFATAATLGGLSLAVAPAIAAPVATAPFQDVAQPGDLLQEAQYYYGRPRYYGPRRYYGRPYYGPRRYYGPRYYPPRFYGPRYYAPRYFY